MIKLLVQGKEYENLIFQTHNIEKVIDEMHKTCKERNSLIFGDRTLWKIVDDGKKLIHETAVSYSEFEIVYEKNPADIEPRIVQLGLYGDYRDNLKTSDYVYKVNFEHILYNLTFEDCLYIIKILHKNIMFGENVESGKGYDTIASYSVYERGSDRWADVSLKDSADKLKWVSFRMSYNLQTKHFNVNIGSGHPSELGADGSAVIMIYEYFLNKQK